MHGLTAEEATRAQCVGVTLLYAYGVDAHGWPDSYLESVAFCLNDDEVRRERETRPLDPHWDGLKTSAPLVLLDLVADGRVSADRARAFLARIDAGEPYHALEPTG